MVSHFLSKMSFVLQEGVQSISCWHAIIQARTPRNFCATSNYLYVIISSRIDFDTQGARAHIFVH